MLIIAFKQLSAFHFSTPLPSIAGSYSTEINVPVTPGQAMGADVSEVGVGEIVARNRGVRFTFGHILRDIISLTNEPLELLDLTVPFRTIMLH